jgi:GT2 family glycosyltransferase
MIEPKILDISVIIPFHNKSSMTIACVQSLIKYGPPLSEIALISNNSSKEELKTIVEFANQINNVFIYEYNKPFNYQKINNWAVRKCKSETIMFLNNDTELLSESSGLIEKMYKKAHMKTVGMTGCLLLFGDKKTIQHAGVYLMPEGQADHLYITKKYIAAIVRNDKNEFPYDITVDRPLTSVTGAVNIIERKKFDSVGGFDEKFIICGGDVDLCIRLNSAGYQTWYVAGGYILHKESQSRKHTPVPYNDFYCSYLSYIKGFDPIVGDPFLPEITKLIKINGV